MSLISAGSISLDSTFNADLGRSGSITLEFLFWKAWCFLWRAGGLSRSLEVLHTGQCGTLVFIIQTDNRIISKCWKRADKENVMYCLRKDMILIFCIPFGGQECVGHFFDYVDNLVFLRDVWIRAALASRRATNLATHLPCFFTYHLSINQHVILGRK